MRINPDEPGGPMQCRIRAGCLQSPSEDSEPEWLLPPNDVARIGTGVDELHAPVRALYEPLGFIPYPTVEYARTLRSEPGQCLIATARPRMCTSGRVRLRTARQDVAATAIEPPMLAARR
jgi:hypothetical protein